jgi:hypothetical protein
VRVPESVIARMREGEAAGRAVEEGLQIALGVAGALRGRVAGVIVSGAGDLTGAIDAIRAKVL